MQNGLSDTPTIPAPPLDQEIDEKLSLIRKLNLTLSEYISNGLEKLNNEKLVGLDKEIQLTKALMPEGEKRSQEIERELKQLGSHEQLIKLEIKKRKDNPDVTPSEPPDLSYINVKVLINEIDILLKSDIKKARTSVIKKFINRINAINSSRKERSETNEKELALFEQLDKLDGTLNQELLLRLQVAIEKEWTECIDVLASYNLSYQDHSSDIFRLCEKYKTNIETLHEVHHGDLFPENYIKYALDAVSELMKERGQPKAEDALQFSNFVQTSPCSAAYSILSTLQNHIGTWQPSLDSAIENLALAPLLLAVKLKNKDGVIDEESKKKYLEPFKKLFAQPKFKQLIICFSENDRKEYQEHIAKALKVLLKAKTKLGFKTNTYTLESYIAVPEEFMIEVMERYASLDVYKSVITGFKNTFSHYRDPEPKTSQKAEASISPAFEQHKKQNTLKPEISEISSKLKAQI